MNLVTMDLGLQSVYLAEASILLILLAGGVLLYWSFRERYLVPWIAGWSAYSGAKFYAVFSQVYAPSPLGTALAYTFFVAAVGLFSSSVLLYVYRKRLLWRCGAVLGFALIVGLLAALWRPDSTFLNVVFNWFSWRLVVIVAAAQLFRFAWGRRNIGRWLLAAMLLTLHTEINPHDLAGLDILFDLLLGISMMIIVLDDSRVQIQRLDILNAITQRAHSNELD